MKISLIQMNMALGAPEQNFTHAKELVRKAAEEAPDVIVLPETWNVGFFPKSNLSEQAERAGELVRERFGRLARELSVNIIAGSVADARGGLVYNTSYIFNREGVCLACYDKTHLFTPMGEERFFARGNRVVDFTIDGVRCGIIICYDLRFGELIRTLALRGIEILFVPAQWPEARSFHWDTLNRARAIENQIYVACCNSCGTADGTKYGGHSALLHPLGETVVQAGTEEEIVSGELDLAVIREIRETINVYRDRRPELYKIN